MCGIAGIYHPSGRPAEPGRLGPMLDRIVHRGPDGRGIWSEGPYALGHVRLAVLDLTRRAHQPMLVDEGRGVLVYNGEVYNFTELRAELESEGVRFESTGDAEVVAQALHRWGPERATPRLDGMFAFAYHDRRDGSLWLGRDRIGIKPLSFVRLGDAFLFASEVKALLAHPDVPCDMDPLELSRYIATTRPSATRSIVRGVELLAPGSLLRLAGERREEVRYFDLTELVSPERLVGRTGRKAAIEAAEAFESLIGRSVRGHLQSDVPVATMCSGGVDSSLVTALAAAERPEIEAWVADVGRPSEAGAARTVGRHLGVPVHAVPLPRESYLRLWPEAAWHDDEPSTHPSAAPLLAVARACRAAGFVVMLTGEGSDEIFGGYRWYHEIHSGRRRMRRGSSLPGPLGRPWRALWSRMRHAPHERAIGAGSKRLRVRLPLALHAEELLEERRLEAHLAELPPEEKAVTLAVFDDVRHFLRRILSRHDHMGMAGSIETRLPFLGNHMVELGLNLPYALKRRRGEAKWPVRRVARRWLPEEIISAPKRGFPVDTGLYAGSEGLLRGGFVPDLLGWPRARVEELLPIVAEHSYLTFTYTALEIWARLYLGGESPDAIAERLLKLPAPEPR